MNKPRAISFKSFRLTVKPGSKPDSYLISFSGGTDMDSSGWESNTGDRKKLEDEFKFMFNPFDAPSNKKGEYMLVFKIPEKQQKFMDWLDKQKKLFYGVEDDK
jgi:hypothetical protein